MQTISMDYKNYFNTHLSVSPKTKIVVDGVEYLGDKIKTAPKFSHSNSTFIGGFPAKTVNFEMLNLNNNIDFEDKEVEIYKGLVINGKIEYIKQGVFIPRTKDIETNISTKSVLFKNVTDKTQVLDDIYHSDLDWTVKHSGLEIVVEICNTKNLTLENENFPFSNFMFSQPNISSKSTYREVLSRLGEIGGAIVIFNNNGNLEIKSRYNTGDTISRTRYNKLSREKSFTPNLLVIGNKGYDNDIIYPNPKPLEPIELRIEDNPFIDLNREDMIETVANYVLNISYITFEIEDFIDSYNYELNDVISVSDKNGEMFNATILNISSSSRIKSKISAPKKEKTLSNYNIAGSNKKAIDDVKFEVNHINNDIKALITSTKEIKNDLEETSNNLENNYYQKTTVEQLLLDSTNGLTNTFSEAGGNNILRNTNFSAKEVLEDGQTFEYWYGSPIRTMNNNSANSYSILLQNETLFQEQKVANGVYTLSFFYRKLNPLAKVYLRINGKQYELDEENNYKLFQTGIKENEEYIIDPINIVDNYIKIEFESNINNACELYDIMLNFGRVKLAYSQNENETVTDTVNIGKGITITSSTDDIKFVANNNNIGFKNSSDKFTTEFTPKGLMTDEIEVQNEAIVVGILRQRVGDQIWDCMI